MGTKGCSYRAGAQPDRVGDHRASLAEPGAGVAGHAARAGLADVGAVEQALGAAAQRHAGRAATATAGAARAGLTGGHRIGAGGDGLADGGGGRAGVAAIDVGLATGPRTRQREELHPQAQPRRRRIAREPQQRLAHQLVLAHHRSRALRGHRIRGIDQQQQIHRGSLGADGVLGTDRPVAGGDVAASGRRLGAGDLEHRAIGAGPAATPAAAAASAPRPP